ncbi:MAG: beta-lactamase [Herbinix sp.]|jgi:hypothetical protein|nr:beta-lactamase [Herbinix sp.]
MNEFLLERSTPEQQGVKSGSILSFLQAVEQCRSKDMGQDFHSFMMLRHGYVIAEGWWGPYQKEIPHILFSLSKSFTSTAIGFAVSEGLLSVEDLVVSYFKEEYPNPSGNWNKMRIKHLLNMSTGHVEDTTDFFFKREDGNWVKAFLEVPVEKEPGTHFLYNTGATYMLSVILQRVTGQKLIDYLRTRLFEPLGIEKPVWEECPMGYNTGGFGLSVRTEDIAKFGQLYLNQGIWNGKQLLPKAWIEEATTSHISNGDNPESDWNQGYGYQFWRCRHDIYRGDGAFGQFCIVMPKEDVVIAITGGMKDMQLPLNLVFEHLLPGITNETLTEGSDTTTLKEKLNSLQVMLPDGMKQSEIIPKINGRCFPLRDNMYQFETITFQFETDKILLKILSKGKEQELEIGIGYWTKGFMENDRGKIPVMLTGIWQENTKLSLSCRYIETPFADQMIVSFQNDQIQIAMKENVGFSEPTWNEVLGI